MIKERRQWGIMELTLQKKREKTKGLGVFWGWREIPGDFHGFLFASLFFLFGRTEKLGVFISVSFPFFG